MMEPEKLARKNILELRPYTSAREKFRDGIFLDANENSFGSAIRTAVADLNRYPDPNQRELRNALSVMIKTDSNRLFFGVGSDEIIDLIIRIFCEPGKSNVLIPEPTYGMFKVACEINDVAVKTCGLDPDFNLDLSSVNSAVDENTKMIFLCSPNNPTGNLLDIERIKSLARSFNGMIFLDEAYIDFSESSSFIYDSVNFRNVIISRTFSKAWGLAGARCGYCVADESVIQLLFKIKAPYSISRLTSDVILRAIPNKNARNKMISEIIEEKNRLISEIRSLDYVDRVFPSDANFILVKMLNAERVFDHLNSSGIRTRMRNDNERLTGCLRITVGTPDENKILIKVLREIN